jgi:hypothetical protein
MLIKPLRRAPPIKGKQAPLVALDGAHTLSLCAGAGRGEKRKNP